MFIALTSVSKDPVVFPVLERIAAAIEVQLYQHYATFWQSAGMNVRVVKPDDAILRRQDIFPLVVYDTPDEAGTLGYHTINREAQSHGKVFWDVIKASGGDLLQGPGSLPTTISHEALEGVGNPYINAWVDLDESTQEGVELADRCEADFYDIDGISVSDFLGPRAFRDGPGPYDWMNLLKSPWEIRPGGYVIRRKGDKVFNVWGERYPENRKPIKTASFSRLATRQALLTSKDSLP